MPRLSLASTHRLACGDCLDVMRTLPANSVDSVVTDPPYGIGFLGREWDAAVPGEEFATEALRVLKPGGHLVAFAATKTVHRLACAIEDAGFEIRDQIAWLQWMGMPHSLDISKSIDKMKHKRAEVLEVTAWIKKAKEAAGITLDDIDNAFGFNGMAGHWTTSGSQPSVPHLEQVPQLLKLLKVEDPPPRIRKLLVDINTPANKPSGNWWKREVTGLHAKRHGGETFAEKHDKSAEFQGYNVPGAERRDKPATELAAKWHGWGTDLKPCQEPAVLARKPFDGSVTQNVLTHGVGAMNIDACRHVDGDRAWPGPQGIPNTPKSDPRNRKGLVGRSIMGDVDPDTFAKVQAESVERLAKLGRWPGNIYQCPKPSAAEKGAGVEHPTVKPVDLMRWLARLVTPPGGTILEPFAGSGSTLVAAHAEGFRVIAVEQSPAYCDIITARMAQVAPDLEALRRGETETES